MQSIGGIHQVGPRTQARGEEQGKLGLGCLLLLLAASASRSSRLAAGMVKRMLADTAFAAIAVAELVSIVVARAAADIVFEATAIVFEAAIVFGVVFEARAESMAAVLLEEAGAELRAATIEAIYLLVSDLFGLFNLSTTFDHADLSEFVEVDVCQLASSLSFL